MKICQHSQGFKVCVCVCVVHVVYNKHDTVHCTYIMTYFDQLLVSHLLVGFNLQHLHPQLWT